MENKVTFRPAVPGDEGLVLSFIRGLGVYEKMSDQITATEEELRSQLFEKRNAEVIFALEGNTPVAFALFFQNFSTFVGRQGLYLEDLFVLPAHRGHGYGKALLQRLAAIAVERNCGRFEWICLDWNEPSIRFYKSLGATPQDEWTIYRVAGDALTRLANGEV